MGRLYKRGDTYWGYWSPAKGQYVRESLRTADREVAKQRLRQRELGVTKEADRAANEAKAPVVGTQLAPAMTAFLATVKNERTKAFYEQRGRHLERVFGPSRLVATICRDEVDDYIETREGEGAHTNTVYKELCCLRGCLRVAKLDEKVVPTYKAGYVPRKRYLTKEAYAKILVRLERHRADWFAIACYAGLRDAEVEQAQPSWLDWNLGVINVGGPELARLKTTGSRRVVPFAEDDRFRQALQRLPVEPWDNVRRDLSRAARSAGIIGKDEWLTPNDLRRTFASWLIQAGVPPFVVARLLGHKSTRMVETVYGQLGLETLRAAIGRI